MHLIKECRDGSGSKRYQIYAVLILCIICFIGLYWFGSYNILQLLWIVSAIILCPAITELLLRVSLFIGEYRSCFVSRYNSDLKELGKSVFKFNERTVLAVFIALIIIIITHAERPPEAYLVCLVSTAAYLIGPFLQLKNAPIYQSIRIASPDVVDVGAAMAVSFFHGYLKILLPQNSTSDRGIKVLMDIYEARERISFVRKALYILVPHSLHCPHQLILESDIMEEAASLNPIEEDRAGVKNRNYKNSVYKIRYDGGFYYVSAEYASPLKTFYESVNSDGMFAEHYKHHKMDILWKFYTTVKKLVKDDPTTNGLCEFIFYADKDKHGKSVDVGLVLLKRLQEDVARYSSKGKPFARVTKKD